MPLPVITSATDSCAYQMCEPSGHTACKTLAAYYGRLCDAAQAAVTNPTGDNLAALQDVLNENEGLHYD